MIFWVVTPCGLVDVYQRFGETAYIFRNVALPIRNLDLMSYRSQVG
jgi:hypothetical protein